VNGGTISSLLCVCAAVQPEFQQGWGSFSTSTPYSTPRFFPLTEDDDDDDDNDDDDEYD